MNKQKASAEDLKLSSPCVSVDKCFVETGYFSSHSFSANTELGLDHANSLIWWFSWRCAFPVLVSQSVKPGGYQTGSSVPHDYMSLCRMDALAAAVEINCLLGQFSATADPRSTGAYSECLCTGCLDLCWFGLNLSFQLHAALLLACHQTLQVTPSPKKLWFLLLLNLKFNYSDYFLQWWEFFQPSHSAGLWLLRKQITCININAFNWSLPGNPPSLDC